MHAPLITVIALCYNHARFLVECLDSIAAQTHADFQLIVTDDASKDNSANLIEQWLAAHRPDATFIQHERNRGICATLNEALAEAKGQFISMIATDDRWTPDKLSTQLQFALAQAPDAAVIYSDAEIMNEQGQCLGRRFIADHRPELAPPSGNIFSDLADGNFMPAMATLIRLDALRQVGGYDESLSYEDYDMWLRLSGAGHSFAYCPQVLAHYRTVSTSMTNSLFIRPTAAHSRTVIEIHNRWFESGLLSRPQARKFSAKIRDAAYNLFVLDDPQAARYLRLAARRAKTIRIFILACAATLGIKRTQAAGFMRKLGLRSD